MQQQPYPPQGQWAGQPPAQQPYQATPPQQGYPAAPNPQQQWSAPTPPQQQWPTPTPPQQQWPTPSAPTPGGNGPKGKLTPVKIAGIVLAVVLLLVVAGVGYKVFAPKAATSNDSNPFANASPGTSTTQGTVSTPGTSGTTTTGSSGPVVLATGKFIDTGSGDHGSGDVTIGKTADGKYQIFLSNLNVVAGPDLHVYLATPANPSGSDQVLNGGVDLGSLKANQGNVTVNVPADVASNLKNYQSVVIYCKSFAVIFTAAPLTFQG